jgi:asparagine synthase (glutamine-hydrolysing)
MCGIFALLNNNNDLLHSFIKTQFEKGQGRGPEFSILTEIMLKAQFGFHRLAINGQNAESNQPLVINSISLICNGEIYNYKQLYELMDVDPTTDSDCEVIIHLYERYGIEQTLQMLDGVFAFVLMDSREIAQPVKMFMARDPYGVRPLYMMKVHPMSNLITVNTSNLFGVASELKMLTEICSELNNQTDAVFNNKKKQKNKKQKNKKHMRTTNQNNAFSTLFNNKYLITQFEPGTYSQFELPYSANTDWKQIKHQMPYHKMSFSNSSTQSLNDIYANIQYYLYSAVEKRCTTTDRPIACLLSGGLDSSLIAALVMEFRNRNQLSPVETYSIGLAGSEDLRCAKIVANYLGTKHTEILLTEDDFLNAIPDVIHAIESYDTTSVRASIGNWLLGKYIREHSDAKVIFNGDGSDELTGGYLYMGCAPDAIEFDRECRRLLKDIHAFDVLRSDKCISSHGLEPRTPFLDRAWTQYYLSISPEMRFHNSHFSKQTNQIHIEKQLLRTAFSANFYCNMYGQALLPDTILWRKKEAFSDGVSKHTRSLYEIIKDHAAIKFMELNYTKYIFMMNDTNVYQEVAMIYPGMEEIDAHLLPKTAEQLYYRMIFEKSYPGMGKIVPYFWMPKYVDATDASARTLAIYSK